MICVSMCIFSSIRKNTSPRSVKFRQLERLYILSMRNRMYMTIFQHIPHYKKIFFHGPSQSGGVGRNPAATNGFLNRYLGVGPGPFFQKYSKTGLEILIPMHGLYTLQTLWEGGGGIFRCPFSNKNKKGDVCSKIL